MIRWSYLVPRLLIVATLLSAYWFGLNPLVRWTLVHTGQWLTSAKVDLSAARVSLLRGEIALDGLEVADPSHPLKNLLAADGLELDLDTAALLRHKLIVDKARATGLRVDTDRQTSGALEPGHGLDLTLPGKELLAAGGQRLAELGRQWLEQVAAGLEQDLAREIQRLESVRTVGELVERWSRQCQDLESRAGGLRLRIEQVRGAFANPPANPLEALSFYRQVTAELETIQRDVEQLQRQCQQLPQQAARDREAVAAAARRDQEDLRRRFRIDDARPEQLSEYLLQREFGEKMSTLAQWVRWISRQGTPEPQPPDAPRGRGVDVVPANPIEPDFLIRWLSVEGRAWYDGRAYDFLATIRGLTNQPKVARAPTVIRARVKLPAEMWVEVSLDRTGAEPHDRIVVQCPALAQPSRTLGKPDQLALTLAPGTMSLGLEVELRGRCVLGRLRVLEEPVEFLPVVGPRCGGTRVASLLQTALRGVRRLEAEVQLHGTAEQLQWRLESSLGSSLVAGLSTAVRAELETRRDQLLAEIERRVAAELNRAEQMLAGKQDELLGKVQGAIVEARQVGNSLAQRLSPNLPGGLPANLPLRF